MYIYISPAPTYIHSLSLHDALPICKALANAPWTLGQLKRSWEAAFDGRVDLFIRKMHEHAQAQNRVCLSEDRKSTRLNSSHMSISYAVFCLKKKKSERKRVHTSDTT